MPQLPRWEPKNCLAMNGRSAAGRKRMPLSMPNESPTGSRKAPRSAKVIWAVICISLHAK
jgi:hypothetical protein